MLQADPYALRYAALRFSSGANELRSQATRLLGRKLELVSNGWRGTASQSFGSQVEQHVIQLRKNAEVLEHAATVLNQLATRVETILELRRQAEQYERASWECGGDSIDDLHQRQNLARQAAYYRQQAELEANQADSQASGQLHQIMSLIPYELGGRQAVGNGDELDNLPEPLKNYYKRHPELLEEQQGTSHTPLSSAEEYARDHEQLLEAVRQYFMSKMPDYYSEDMMREAAEPYLTFLYDSPNEQLFNYLQNLLSSDERAQYYQKLVQDPNFDAKDRLANDPEYRKYVVQQSALNESPGSLAVTGVSFAFGIMNAFRPKYKPDGGVSTSNENNGSTGNNMQQTQNPTNQTIPKRPNWRQSEKDIQNQNPEYQPQKSFKDGVEVPYGTKGSSRPDFYKIGSSLEVKNYDVTTPAGRNRLIKNVVGQVLKRMIDLPPNTKQTVIIDIRGQIITSNDLREIRDAIYNETNGNAMIKFITE